MPQWVVTVAFYKARHIVEAVFAADKYSPICFRYYCTRRFPLKLDTEFASQAFRVTR